MEGHRLPRLRAQVRENNSNFSANQTNSRDGMLNSGDRKAAGLPPCIFSHKIFGCSQQVFGEVSPVINGKNNRVSK